MDVTPEMILRGYQANTSSLEDMLFVKGKVAIVTGGTSGLGFCVARRLCQGGAKVVIASSTEEKGALALTLLKEEGFDVVFCKCDVRNEEAVKHLVTFTAETFGSIDILVTAAGIWSFAHIEDLEEAIFKDTLDVNLLGAYRCVKHVSTYMIEHKIKGKLLLVSSNSAYLPQPVFGGYAHYTASKGGVIAMTTELAKELKRYGIMVNTVAPGGMFTPGCLTNGPVPTLPPEKQMELGKEMTVAKLDEIPTADSVAIVIYGMCTHMADGVTGKCIVADSGMMRNIMSFQPPIEQYPPAN